MSRVSQIVGAILALTCVIPAFSDDQKNAEKQLHKITAMATDATGRRVVSITVADSLEANRFDLAMERRAMRLNYGDLFVAHVLVKQGVKMEAIAAQLKAGKNIGQIANEHHADWKQIAAEAKKLNTKMEDNLYKHFLNGKHDAESDKADGYDPTIDGVTADNDVSESDIADAERTYRVWRERAERRRDSKLDASSEGAARAQRGDPVRSKAGNLSPTSQ